VSTGSQPRASDEDRNPRITKVFCSLGSEMLGIVSQEKMTAFRRATERK
jgi:hypothetical protein